MAKQFKLRISRIILSCRSKDPSNLPQDPVPSFLRLSPVNPKSDLIIAVNQFPPPSTPYRPSIRRHVSSALISAGCSFGSKSGSQSDPPHSPEFKWQKEEKWHVIYDPSEKCEEENTAGKKTKRRSRKKKTTTRPRNSEFDEPDENRAKKKKANRAKRRVPEMESPARLSVFKKLIPCAVEGKVRESFAVVKKSEDPYEDFRRSMVEMIMEKQMFEKRDLEQLLQCFLSLNSERHHGVILEAFSEIWGEISQ